MEVTIQVEYKGEQVDVVIEDDIAFGKLSDLINGMITIEDLIHGKISTDLYSFVMNIVPLVVVKAPWNMENKDWFKNMGQKTARQLILEVSKLYPLGEYLQDIHSAMNAMPKNKKKSK